MLNFYVETLILHCINLARYVIIKVNKKHFAYCFKMIFRFCVYLPWKPFLCWVPTKSWSGHEFDLSRNIAWLSFSVWFDGLWITYIWNSLSIKCVKDNAFNLLHLPCSLLLPLRLPLLLHLQIHCRRVGGLLEGGNRERGKEEQERGREQELERRD